MSAEIDDLAAAWAARVDRGLTSEEERALEAWLSSDARNLGAYAKARAVAVHSERARALGPNFDPTHFAPTEGGLTRRRILWVGAGLGAAASILAAIGGVIEFRSGRYTTHVGETRSVPLEDGSVITLNTASKVAVSYTGQLRSVELIAGEALFDVAKDPSRPFIVDAGDTQVRAVGTSFLVRRLQGQPVQVLVREGLVEVKRSDAVAEGPVRVGANTRAVALTHASISTLPVQPKDISRELAWREGRIAFEGETLREAASMFARYSDTQIVIDDPSIARQTITGLFISNDPIGFSKAVALSLNLRAEVGNGIVKLTR